MLKYCTCKWLSLTSCSGESLILIIFRVNRQGFIGEVFKFLRSICAFVVLLVTWLIIFDIQEEFRGLAKSNRLTFVIMCTALLVIDFVLLKIVKVAGIYLMIKLAGERKIVRRVVRRLFVDEEIIEKINNEKAKEE